ncbi:MAG TPA: hypothetical protein VG735_08115 [Caulobacterales bacterium]|nr:hypothetical protein [Caulobacterales bacterium]
MGTETEIESAMTVAELIAKLQTLPADLQIRIYDGDELLGIDDVTIAKGDDARYSDGSKDNDLPLGALYVKIDVIAFPRFERDHFQRPYDIPSCFHPSAAHVSAAVSYLQDSGLLNPEVEQQEAVLRLTVQDVLRLMRGEEPLDN